VSATSPTPATTTTATTPLRSARLRRIITAYTVNRLGTWFGYVALSLAVFEHTHSALAVAALLIAGQALPAFLAPAIVARAEASPRRAELSALYLFEAIATAALAGLLLWHFWLPGVLLLVALDGTAALAANALLRAAAARCAREFSDAPHEQRATPTPAAAAAAAAESLPPHTYAGQAAVAPASGSGTSGHGASGQGTSSSGTSNSGTDGANGDGSDPREAEAVEAERRTNAALNIAFSSTLVIGPVLAGVMVAIAGGPAALIVDAASFAICGAMLIDLHPHIEEAGEASVRDRLRAAWAHINDVVSLRTLLLTQGVALIFFAADGSIEVPYATVTLGAGDRGYGLLLTVWGAGMVLGSLLFARMLKRSLGAILSVGTLAVGLAYLGWSVAPSLAVACAAGLLGGIGNGMQWAAFISAVQRLTPENLHGRMMGAVESLGAICPAIGLALGGALVALSSPRGAFLVVGLGATLSTVAFVRLRLTAPASATPASSASDVEPEWAPPPPQAPSPQAPPPQAPDSLRPEPRAHLKDHAG
jgi:predicted MFS family arabinose efflux permease